MTDTEREQHFERWWEETGKYIDPDTEDVPWFDKRKELAGLAYMAGSAESIRKAGQ